MSRGVQATVNTQPAPGVAGDFCTANPRFTTLAGPGGFVAGAAGVIVGNFCWASDQAFDPDNAPQIVNSFGSGPVAGFIGRAQQGLITQFLQDASMIIPQGFMTTVYSGGDFFVINSGTASAVWSAVSPMKAYANLSTGAVTFALTGSAATSSSSATSIAAETLSITASITGNIMTVTAVASGSVAIGSVLSGTNVATGTTVTQQLSGTALGVGTYSVSIGEQTVASETITGTYGLMTVGGTLVGTVPIGAVVGGASAGTVVTAFGTGTGGAGTYYVNNTQTLGSTAVTFTTNVETKWIAMSGGATGELVKISSQPLG